MKILIQTILLNCGNQIIKKANFHIRQNYIYIYTKIEFIEENSDQFYDLGYIVTNQPNAYGCPNIVEIQRYYNFANEPYKSTPKTFLGFSAYHNIISNKEVLNKRHIIISEYSDNPRLVSIQTQK